MIRIVSLYPELLDLNGDSRNALVLERRARWAGREVAVDDIPVGSEPETRRPSIVVVGSGSESSLVPVLTALRSIESLLKSWVAAGVPVLAVGTGWELLSRGLELPDGTRLDGLGVFSGWSVPSPRVSDDIVVDTTFGRLVGFENHAREYHAEAGARALGTVAYGVGNSVIEPDAVEGEIAGSAIGTHLHGPVLAKNPALADHLLTIATDGEYSAINPQAQRADRSAQFARDAILAKLGLSATPS
jgi:CobQ-like glutamine amidotransferase family enzyme